MSANLAAVTGGLSAMAGWGIADWLTARNSKKYSSLEVNLAVQIPGLTILLFIMLATGQHMPGIRHIEIISLAGLIFTAAYLCLVKALRTGYVGVIVPLSSIYPLVTILLTFIFLTTSFSALQILSMFIIILGTILLAYEKNRGNVPLHVFHRESFFALGATMLWGLGFFILNTIIGKEPWEIVSGFVSVSMGVYSVILILLTGFRTALPRFKTMLSNRQGIAAGTVVTLGSLAFFSGATKAGSIVVPTVIGSASPLVASALSAYKDHEKINLVKRFGAVVAISGIILLNL